MKVEQAHGADRNVIFSIFVIQLFFDSMISNIFSIMSEAYWEPC